MEISNITDIVSAGGVIISIVYLAKQIKNSNTIHFQNHEWNRRIETKKALDQYNKLEAVERLEEVFRFSAIKHPIPIDDINKKTEEEKLLGLAITRLLNYYEGLCNGIDMGVYDEMMIKEARRGNMIRAFNAFSNFIAQRRREGSSNKIFMKYEKYTKKWLQEEQEGLVLNKLGSI